MSVAVAPARRTARGARAASLLTRARDRVGIGGLIAGVFIVALAIVAIFAPLIAPYEPNVQDLLNTSAGPSSTHLLGTDNLGRDLLSRLIWGARPSLLGPLIVIGIATLIAVPVALVSGWMGGKVDLVISRILDLIFAFPGILLAVLVVALWGPGLVPCSISLAIAYMPWIARVCRSGILKERNKPYIAAAEVQGLSGFAICTRHLIPNIAPIIWSQATISFGYALVDLAALSFLGLNIQPPESDWGVMTNNEIALIGGHLAELLIPCAMIVLCVTAVTYLGNRLSTDVSER